MRVTTQQVELLRAQMFGHEEQFRNAGTHMTDADVPGYEALLQAALSIVASRRFASGYSNGDLIRYVARVRAGTTSRDEDIALDPLSSEVTLRFALGEPSQPVQDPQVRLRSMMALLTALIADLELTHEAVGAVLDQAIPFADRWLAASTNW